MFVCIDDDDKLLPDSIARIFELSKKLLKDNNGGSIINISSIISNIIDFIIESKIPFYVIATKTDKLNQSELA